MKTVKFLKEFVHGNKQVDKKGSIRNVTSRHADFLAANKIVEIQEAKEDKKAKDRETK